jgi:hypothetical protein
VDKLISIFNEVLFNPLTDTDKTWGRLDDMFDDESKISSLINEVFTTTTANTSGNFDGIPLWHCLDSLLLNRLSIILSNKSEP